jgi:hypothetical protein
MAPPLLVYQRLEREMVRLGVNPGSTGFLLVGGIISRDPTLSGLEAATNLLEADRKGRVEAARFGLAESGPAEGACDEQDLLPSTGRPHTLSVVLSAHRVYWRGDGDRIAPLCPRVDLRGSPL